MIIFGSYLRACWFGFAATNVLVYGSRHCHLINITHQQRLDHLMPCSTSQLSTSRVLRMDRREFSKLSAFALASSFVPSFAQNATSGKPVGYAAIGLGRICDIFMRACALTQ